jgi:hypothetical protein
MLAGGEVKGTIELSTTYKLPNIDAQKLRNDPLTVLGGAGKQMMDSAETELKATLLGQGAAAGDGGGLKAEASFKGPTRDITSANVAVMADLARGRFSDAARELGTVSKKIEVKASVAPFVTRGVDLQASGALLGVGIGGKLKGQRMDVKDPLWNFKGTLDEAAVKLGTNAVKTAEILRPTALPIRY